MSIITTEHWCYIEFFFCKEYTNRNFTLKNTIFVLNLILAKSPPKTTPLKTTFCLLWPIKSVCG